MEFERLKKLIDGLIAYDDGATDSGLHDESAKQEIRDYLAGLSNKDHRVILSRVIRDLYLSDVAIEEGYGWEDAKSLGRWLENDLSF